MKMRDSIRRIKFFTIIFSLICFLWGVGIVSAASIPKKGGLLTVGLNTDITTLQFYSTTAMVNAIVFNHVLEPLLAYSKKMEILPVLAERWETSSDYKTYTFYLMKGKYFHNGKEMEAEDVKYSLETIMDPKTKCPKASLFKEVDRIEIADKYKVVVHFKEPDPGFPHALAYIAPVMAIIPKGDIEKQGGTITQPVGTGPYKFVEWKADRHVILDKFDNYKTKTDAINGMGGERIAYADRIKFIPIPEESVAIMALLNKEIDFLQIYPAKYVEKYYSTYKNQGIVMNQITGLVWTEIFFGIEQPFTDNVKFRQACAYAIDTELVVQAAFLGHAEVNPSAIPRSNQYWTPYHNTWYKKDLAKAKQLLKESGYDGEEIVIDTCKKYEYMYKMAVAVQSELKGAGINATINVVDWPVLLKEKHLTGNSQIHSFGAAPQPDPANAYVYFRRNKFEQNFPKAQKLREAALATVDFDERVKIFEELHKITYEQVPMIVMANYVGFNAARDYVKGYESLPTNMHRFWGVWIDK